jgi:hypothetical protein
MSRRYAHQKTDANHREIVEALRKVGCTVQSLASVGQGCPDLLVGFLGRNTLLEVKDGKKPPSQRALNDSELKWHQTWRGNVFVVESVADAFRIVGVVTGT